MEIESTDKILVISKFNKFRGYNISKNRWITKWYQDIKSVLVIVNSLYPEADIGIKNYLD